VPVGTVAMVADDSSGECGRGSSPLSESDSASSGTLQEYYTPREGSSCVQDSVEVVAGPVDEVYSALRSQVGAQGADFREAEGMKPLDVGLSTFAVFLLFADESRREQCWSSLEQRINVRAETWFSVEQTARSPPPSSVDEDRLAGKAAPEACSVILLLDLPHPVSGRWSGTGLEGKLEKVLGCPPSRGGRLSPVLKKAVSSSFEVVSLETMDEWLEQRSVALDRCWQASYILEWDEV